MLPGSKMPKSWLLDISGRCLNPYLLNCTTMCNYCWQQVENYWKLPSSEYQKMTFQCMLAYCFTIISYWGLVDSQILSKLPFSSPKLLRVIQAPWQWPFNNFFSFFLHFGIVTEHAREITLLLGINNATIIHKIFEISFWKL